MLQVKLILQKKQKMFIVKFILEKIFWNKMPQTKNLEINLSKDKYFIQNAWIFESKISQKKYSEMKMSQIKCFVIDLFYKQVSIFKLIFEAEINY